MLAPIFLYIGIALKFSGGFSYLWATARGKNRPNRVSFAMWALASFTAFAGQLGENVSLLDSSITFFAGFLPLSVLIVSFFNKNAYWKLRMFDYTCGLFSIFGLILWAITGDGLFAILFAILGDGFAYIPTIRKSYTHPGTETAHSYILNALGIGIFLLSVQNLTFSAFIFPFYILVLDSLVYTIIRVRRKQLITTPGTR